MMLSGISLYVVILHATCFGDVIYRIDVDLWRIEDETKTDWDFQGAVRILVSLLNDAGRG